LFRRKDGKYVTYVPKDMSEDMTFPFKGADSLVKVSFKAGENKLSIEEWTGQHFHKVNLTISLFLFLSNLPVITTMR